MSGRVLSLNLRTVALRLVAVSRPLGEAFRRCGIASGRFGTITAHYLVTAAGGTPSVMPMPARAPIDLVIGFALRALFVLDQGLPVGDRDLIVVRMDFAKGKKAVAVAAVIDEGGLQ